MSETNEVILLNEDVALSAAAFSRLKTLVVQYLGERGSTTVSELRQVIGTTRRVLVPFLERLDRLGVTVREGDRRKLR
jgi:selenocysteine-specific elongation factor